jgi:competence protein ComEC
MEGTPFVRRADLLFGAGACGWFLGCALAPSVGDMRLWYMFLVSIAGLSLGVYVWFRHAPQRGIYTLQISERTSNRAIQTSKMFLALACICVCTALALWRYDAVHQHIVTRLAAFEGAQVTLRGVIAREPERREAGTHLTVSVSEVSGIASRGVVRVFYIRHSTLRYGDEVQVVGTLARATSFDTEFGRSFEYGRYLEAQGIDHVMRYPTIELLNQKQGSAIIHTLLVFKEHIVHTLSRALVAPESGLALGILLGEKQLLGKDLLTTFQTAGLVHIVVLSGYNISILIEALWRLLMFTGTKVRVIASLVVIVLFVLMVGATATVLRASLMAGLVLLARLTNRTYAIFRALVFTGVVMLVWNPLLLAHDPGFQLSFLATFGLIVLAPQLEGWLPPLQRMATLRDYFISSFAAQTMTMPLIAWSIGTISIVGIVANILVVPLVPFAMLASGITAGVGMANLYVGRIVGFIAHTLLHYMISVAEFVEKIPFASLPLPPFSFVWVILAYVLLMGVFFIQEIATFFRGIYCLDAKEKPFLLGDIVTKEVHAHPRRDTPISF